MTLISSAPTAPPSDAPHMVARACQAHKFGGSSLADASCLLRVAGLLRGHAAPQKVVVSAMHGVTDALTVLAYAAMAREPFAPMLEALRQKHMLAANALDADDAHGVATWLEGEFDRLAVHLRHLDTGALAEIQGLGEVWSSRLLHAALGGEAAGWSRLDARDVLQVQPGELGVAVDWPATRALLGPWQRAHPQPNTVVTGFIARDEHGGATTLGRNGSDYSGAIFAVLFEAADLTIWTDVDGVLSADPRLEPDAVCLSAMSYAEACELAYFGAKVLHPQTMAPVIQSGLPLRIRNSLRPHAIGTLITRHGATAASPVKGISLIEHMAILELSGAGMIGVPGTAERLFSALREARVSVTMISQGSSEHSICCVIPAAHAHMAHVATKAAFADAQASGQIEGVSIKPDIAILAAVGDGMVGTIGVAARLLDGLAQAHINIRAIAQGASERNISVAIEAADAVRALRAAHSAFWLSPQTLSVGLIGPGNVGRALLAQFAATAHRYGEGDAARPTGRRGLDLRLRAIADSRRMALTPRAMPPDTALMQLAEGEPLDLARFAAHVKAEHLPHALIIDCSGSDAIAECYPQWLAAGIHVVTPSKHAGAGPLARYRAIRDAMRHGGDFRYEATVGAGLPVIQTLRNQLDTGDELTEIEGVLSGTLAWLFNRFDGSVPFSALVREAMSLGYTEPDPRDDLSGTDVARKLVILAREAGRDLSLDDVTIESLVPAALQLISRDEFVARLSELDAPLAARLKAAQDAGLGLRYLARLDRDGKAVVGLTCPAPNHASLHSQLTDNLIQFRTRRYADNPLVVQGPGAGPDVTAAGVFSDVLAIAQALGARL